MATYAAVVSLIHITENITTFRVRDPKFLVEQNVQLQSFRQNSIYLTEFLENSSARGYSNGPFEDRIFDAACKAEDIIETYIVDYLEAKHVDENGSENYDDWKMLSDHFSMELQKVLEHINLVVVEAMEIKASSEFQVQNLQHQAILTKPPRAVNNLMELFHDEANVIMDKLMSSGEPKLLTCSIVGMGGTGKTTLAKKVYGNENIVNYFDVCCWVTVSQEFNARELLVVLLNDANVPCDKSLDYEQLGEGLYKHLFGRRCLIVMDDVWDIEALGKLKRSIPDDENGSRVLVTTRMSTISVHCDFTYEMNFLDEKQSWELLCDIIFGKLSCPSHLKGILEIIARNCRGLLISVSVIGGLVGSSNMTHGYLEYVAQATSAIVNSSDEDHCLDLLLTSYKHLPVHLKPCFLYLGIFEEDNDIEVTELIRLWVSEGFLKPNNTKSFEEVAEDYINDLIARNMIHITDYSHRGNIKYCKIHDLLRDLCLREARKQMFLYVTTYHNLAISHGVNSYRRVAIHGTFEEVESTQLGNAMGSSLLPRSYIFSSKVYLPKTFYIKLLRVLHCRFYSFNEKEIFKLFNLRYTYSLKIYKFPSSIHLFWNLQTINFDTTTTVTAPSEIWEMPLPRHISIHKYFYLTDPCTGARGSIVVLENLQTLLNVRDFRCTTEVVRKIPNVRELVVEYSEAKMGFNLQNMAKLYKLESLACHFQMDISSEAMKEHSMLLFQSLEFPLSLKELRLSYCIIDWEEDVNRKIGSLPSLQVLDMSDCKSSGEVEWNTTEGQFLSLKALLLSDSDLVHWTTESGHFPCLENLQIWSLYNLEEIPLEIGDIPTLQLIAVIDCSDSALDSAKMILDEQRDCGNEELEIHVRHKDSGELEGIK